MLRRNFSIAGLEVVRIINEPTAASLAYGMDKKEKRKHPRTPVRLPLHLQINENGEVYPGLAIDASESGLLIETLKEMPVGIRIDIGILFPKKLCLPNFKAEAEIVWKDICELG
jgi:hypothetical protein